MENQGYCDEDFISIVAYPDDVLSTKIFIVSEQNEGASLGLDIVSSMILNAICNSYNLEESKREKVMIDE